jgi:hypothetical protein
VIAEFGDVEDVPGEVAVAVVVGGVVAMAVVEMFRTPVDPAVAFHHRRGDLVAVGEGVHGRQEVVPVALLQQIGADGVDGLHLVEGGAVDGLQIVAGDRGELLPVGGVPERQVTQVQHQVVLEELDVLVELQLQQTFVREELIDPPMDLHPVREVGDLGTPVADRLGRGLVDDVPVVDAVRDEGDAAGGGVGLSGEEQVFVVNANGEFEPLLDEELPPIALVRREGVEDQQVGQLRDRLQGAGAGVQPGVPLDLLAVPRVHVHPHAHPGHQVRAGRLGRLQHVPAGVALQYVVTVEEEDVRAARLGDAVVAGSPAASAVPVELEGADPAGVRGGQRPCHVVRPVRAPVVHDHDLDVPQGLLQHGAHGCGQPCLVVVDDHDDGYVGCDVRCGKRFLVHPIYPKCPSLNPVRGVGRLGAT